MLFVGLALSTIISALLLTRRVFLAVILSKSSQTDGLEDFSINHETMSENTILQTSKLKLVELQNLAQEEKLINKGIFDKVSFLQNILSILLLSDVI